MTHSTRTWRRRRPGFSLAEIMIVIVVIGAVLAMGIPKLDLMKYRTDAAIQNVRTILMQAQRTALLRQYDVVITLDTVKMVLHWDEDANDDGVIEATEHVRAYPLEDGVQFSKAPVGISGGSSASISGGSLGSMGGLPSVTFHRDGAASSDLTVFIASPADPTHTYRAIQLTQSTGRTDWYRYSVAANTWVLAGLK
jgi:prepilin-type N-terminal cleavage/methylation domain-containing protein